MSKLTESLEREFEQQRAIIDRLKPENFPNFCEYYFGLPMGAVHKEWFSKYILNNQIKRLLLESPMGSAKSTYVGVFYPIWLLFKNPKERIILSSNTLDTSKDRLRAIRNNFENNERLIEDFEAVHGLAPKPYEGQKWTEGTLYVQGSDSAGPPSIRATATGSAIAGKRCSVFIGDDLCDDKNSCTELLRKKVKQWFNQMALSRLEPDGIVRLIGTDYGEFCLYQDIIQHRGGQYADWTHAVYKSIDKNNTGPNHELWPEVWPLDKLMKRKNEIGTIAFERGYQNNSKIIEGGIFHEANLQYYTDIPENLKYYMGVDLAISAKETADYFVILIIGVDPKTENMYVTDIYRKHINFSTQIDEILKHHNKWNCLGIGIGNKSYQEVMPQTLLSIKALPINRINESTPKEARLTKLSLYFENKKVWIKATQMEFIDEYLTYDPEDRSKSPDILDAFWMAVETALPAMNRNFVSVVAGENRKRNIWGI